MEEFVQERDLVEKETEYIIKSLLEKEDETTTKN